MSNSSQTEASQYYEMWVLMNEIQELFLINNESDELLNAVTLLLEHFEVIE